MDKRPFDALTIAAEEARVAFLQFIREMEEILPPSPKAARRRMAGRKAKAQLNSRQLWRRRRSRGRGTKGGARA